jgi:hypothetical protein
MKRMILITAIFGMVVISGCHWLGGGGWLPGKNGGKAHFGFEAYCVEDEGVYWFHEGEFQYMDKSAGIRFHGTFQWFLGDSNGYDSCEEAAAAGNSPEELSTALIFGTCVTQPGKHEGSFNIIVEDNGTPGLVGDYIEVNTQGCGEDGGDYSHSGTLGGGNIWFDDHED